MWITVILNDITLQEIAKDLELTVGTIMNSHLVYQDRQVPTGHLQHNITCMWLQSNSNMRHEMQSEKTPCNVYCTRKLLRSFAKSDVEAQLYSMCTDKKSICSKQEIKNSILPTNCIVSVIQSNDIQSYFLPKWTADSTTKSPKN